MKPGKEIQGPEPFAIAQAHIEVAGLQPDVHDIQTGEVIKKGNFDEKLPEVHEAISSKLWFYKLLDDVHSGKKSAVVKLALGAIVVTAAIGSGYEFGIRHGKDIREFSHLVKDKFEKK